MSENNSHIWPVVFSTVAMTVSLALFYSAGPALRTRTFHFDYKVDVENIPAGAKHIDVWVPIPHGDAHQQITNLRVYAAYPSAMERATEGSTMLHIGRDNPKEPFTVTISLDAHRQEHVQSRLSGGLRLDRDADSLELAQYLHPDRLVPLHPRIRAMAREVVEKANARTDVEMARAIYDHVVSTVKYDKSAKEAGRG